MKIFNPYLFLILSSDANRGRRKLLRGFINHQASDF